MDIDAVRGDQKVETVAEVNKYNATYSYLLVQFIGLSV